MNPGAWQQGGHPDVPYPIGQHTGQRAVVYDGHVLLEEVVYDVYACKHCGQTNYPEHYGEGKTTLSAFQCEHCRVWLHLPRLHRGELREQRLIGPGHVIG